MSKALVVDTRDNKAYFGEVRSFSPEFETASFFEHTDVMMIGDNSKAVIIPVSAMKMLVNVNTLQAAQATGMFTIDADDPNG